MKMRMLFFCSLLFLMGGDVLLACSLNNYTLFVERHECGHCMAINTTMCSGMCFTQDTNVRGFVGKRFLIQKGCMHRSVVYLSARMPGCPVHIDPLFFYPVAHQCRCTKCNTSKNECVYKPSHIPSKCSEQLRAV
ncbi:thyrotropin subunit beta [Ctenopharyngodon idella]|uniref:thyrotropin subunit beta n=1 Tax=Ctenopharyngodon idella TaxID=7959 RepID=UPI002232C47E|nr:thyrotropin subunit beta [Ctenopharyngodon idella]